VKKRREEWWECPNQFCGAQILFLMLGPSLNRADPTCFCGSAMRRVIRTRGRRYRSGDGHDLNSLDAHGSHTRDAHNAPTHDAPGCEFSTQHSSASASAENSPESIRSRTAAFIKGAVGARRESWER
jgi:hypothetical protein